MGKSRKMLAIDYIINWHSTATIAMPDSSSSRFRRSAALLGKIFD